MRASNGRSHAAGAAKGRTRIVEGVWPHEAVAPARPAAASPAPGLQVAGFVLTVCFACALFQRLAFQGVSPLLASHFDLSASNVADLGALFFWTYLVLMVPSGLLVDTYGARRVAILGAVVSSAGCALFASARTLPDLAVARVVISAGGSVAFLCMVRFITVTFPARKATLTGRGMALANFFGIASGAPLAWLLLQLSWREVWACLAVGWLLLAVLVWDRVPREPEHALASLRPRHVLFELRTVFSTSHTYLAAMVLAGLAGSYWAFANLVGPRLLAASRISTVHAGIEISVLVVGWAVGHLAWGWIGDRFRRDVALVLACALACGTWLVMLRTGPLSLESAVGLFLCAGFFSGASLLVYPMLTERYPPAHAGMVIACANCGIPLGGALGQFAAGRLDGVAALVPILVGGLGALLCAVALRSTRTSRRLLGRGAAIDARA